MSDATQIITAAWALLSGAVIITAIIDLVSMRRDKKYRAEREGCWITDNWTQYPRYLRDSRNGTWHYIYEYRGYNNYLYIPLGDTSAEADAPPN